jgi:hypothetical protein
MDIGAHGGLSRDIDGGHPVSVYDFPRIDSVDCAICGETVTVIIELVAGTPRATGGLMRVPFDPEPTVLSGCEHFYGTDERR